MIHQDCKTDSHRSQVSQPLGIHGCGKNHKDQGKGKGDFGYKATNNGNVWAAAWASARQPLLKAGCPQQVCAPENSTWRPR